MIIRNACVCVKNSGKHRIFRSMYQTFGVVLMISMMQWYKVADDYDRGQKNTGTMRSRKEYETLPKKMSFNMKPLIVKFCVIFELIL